MSLSTHLSRSTSGYEGVHDSCETAFHASFLFFHPTAFHIGVVGILFFEAQYVTTAFGPQPSLPYPTGLIRRPSMTTIIIRSISFLRLALSACVLGKISRHVQSIAFEHSPRCTIPQEFHSRFHQVAAHLSLFFAKKFVILLLLTMICAPRSLPLTHVHPGHSFRMTCNACGTAIAAQ